jgi:hypothetical protein
MTDQLAYVIARQRAAELQQAAARERLARAIANPRGRTAHQRLITRLTARLATRASAA